MSCALTCSILTLAPHPQPVCPQLMKSLAASCPVHCMLTSSLLARTHSPRSRQTQHSTTTNQPLWCDLGS
jgi:hypothetical protein